MQDDFLEKLNKEQREAVDHTTGPLLIIAGAGTGKTRVITSRILKLIEDGKAASDEILALTFTEKASEEMTERVDIAMPLGYEEVWIKTFHGFCEKVLRESGHEIGLSRDYKLLAKLDQWMFMKKHLFDFELDYFRPLGNPASFIDILVTHFSRIKEEFISPPEYLEYAEKCLAELMEKAKKSEQAKIDKKSVLGIEMEEVRKILEAARAYGRYQELMLAENCLDFGDLSYYVLKLFEDRPSVLKHYRERFKFIMVDEFQDTNYAQFKLLLMLAGETEDDGHRNICVVGDDDQSIFRWRGASLSNILQFQKAYPDTKKIVLTENYRSAQNILDASHAFIKFNDPERLEHREGIAKDLKSQTKEKLPIEEMHFESYVDEVGFVVEQVKKMAKSDGPSAYGKIAVLVRANSHAIPFAEEFKRAGIPYRIKTPKGLLSLDEVKNLVALVRALSDKTDDVAWIRLLRMDVFDINMDDILEILKKTKANNSHISDVIRDFEEEGVLPGMESSLTNFVRLIENVMGKSKNLTAGEVINRFLTESGYLDEISKDFTVENQQILENLTSFSRIVWQFEKTAEDPSIIGFAEVLKLIEESNIPLADESSAGSGDVDAVQIFTTHGAKGLEFDTVFVVNLVNGRFPILNKKDPLHVPLELTKEIFPEGDFHIEEERRLFYVAVTRAKKKLFLTYSDKYSGPRKWKRSQFLEEISESKLIKVKDVKKKAGKTMLGAVVPSPISTAPENWALGKSFSYSQIDTFKTCPLKYGYRYVMKVPTPPSHAANFGTSIHETLKDFYRVLMAGGESAISLDLMKTLYAKNWAIAGYESKAHEEERKKQGLKLLEQFFQDNSDPWIVPTFVEKNFNLRVGEYMLRGRIDRIDKLPDGTYEVIDYKTGKGGRALTPDKKLQLYLYALVCRDVFGIIASKLSFYFLEDGEKASVSKAPDELDSVRDDVLAYIEEIKSSDFSPTPGFLCRFCDYRLVCPAV
jgi:DNA helicase II / ATP-dependent DNA helicase PcrA